jgi:hypothetical protein
LFATKLLSTASTCSHQPSWSSGRPWLALVGNRWMQHRNCVGKKVNLNFLQGFPWKNGLFSAFLNLCEFYKIISFVNATQQGIINRGSTTRGCLQQGIQLMQKMKPLAEA